METRHRKSPTLGLGTCFFFGDAQRPRKRSTYLRESYDQHRVQDTCGFRVHETLTLVFCQVQFAGADGSNHIEQFVNGFDFIWILASRL